MKIERNANILFSIHMIAMNFLFFEFYATYLNIPVQFSDNVHKGFEHFEIYALLSQKDNIFYYKSMSV